MKNIWLLMTIILGCVAMTAGSVYYFEKRHEESKYTINRFDITNFRNDKLYGAGTISDIGNGWLQLTDSISKYKVVFPSLSYGYGLSYFGRDNTTSLPLAVYSLNNNSSTENSISPAYRLVETSTLRDLKFLKNVQTAIIPNEETTETYNGPQTLVTTSVSSDQDILAKAHQMFDGEITCNFTSVTKQPSKQAGTYDVILEGSAPQAVGNNAKSVCTYFMSQEMEDSYQYLPTIIKYSPAQKKVMLSKSIQGCRWAGSDLTCLDNKVFDSFRFDQ